MVRKTVQWADLSPAIIIIAVFVLAIFAPLVTSFNPEKTSLANALIPPWVFRDGTFEHILGTDQLGRDIYSRVVYGTRVTLGITGLSILISAGMGSLLGLLAGYLGGVVDILIMRIVDILLALPLFLLAIVVAATLGPSLENVIGIVAVLLWPYFARQVRGEALSLKESQFVDSAAAVGASHARIMFRHILPNLLPSIIVFATLQVNLVIVIEASLSFLGVGVPPPTPSWGRMVSDGREMVFTAWWISTVPGLAISVIVLSVAFLGDTLRDRLDPLLRGRR